MRYFRASNLLLVTAAFAAGCGGGPLPPSGVVSAPVVDTPAISANSGPKSVQWAQFTAPFPPIGGIIVGSDGAVYLNASGELMRYNGGFSSFPYPMTYDYNGDALPLNPGGGFYSLAAEGNGTVVTFVNGDVPTYGAPQSLIGTVELTNNNVVTESIDVTPAMVYAQYKMLTPGPYGAVLAVEYVAAAGDSLVAFAPPGTPPINSGANTGFGFIDAVAQGPDGKTYLAVRGFINAVTDGPEIVRVDPATGQTLGQFPLPPSARVVKLTAGPDHGVWFTDSGLNKVGRITSQGHLKYYDVPNAGLGDITTGSDNALWFINGNYIARINLGGKVTEYAVPENYGTVMSLAAGPAGGACIPHTLYFADANGLGRLTF